MRRSRGIGTAARLATVGSAGILLSATAFVGTAHAAGGVLDTSYGSGGFASRRRRGRTPVLGPEPSTRRAVWWPPGSPTWTARSLRE